MKAKKIHEISVLNEADAIGSAPIDNIGFIIINPIAWHNAAPTPNVTPIYKFPSTTYHL